MLINLIGFNMAWLGLVYWGNAFIIFAAAYFLLHFILLLKGYKELMLILFVTMSGIFIDTLLNFLSVFDFSGAPFIPAWLVVLWVCFATTLSHSLSFLTHSKVLQVIAGLFAPLSYIAGYQLNAVSFGYSLFITYCVLALIWVFLFLLFCKVQLFFSDNEVAHA